MGKHNPVEEGKVLITTEQITEMMDILLATPTFYMLEAAVIRKAVKSFKKGSDFAEYLIVYIAKHHQAEKLFSFDKKFQKYFHDFVKEW